MISAEASEKLAEAFRQITIFLILFLGTLLVVSITLIILGIYFLHKGKLAKEAKTKKKFKILAIICWILAVLIISYIIWLYIV